MSILPSEEKGRVGYQAALQMISYEGQIIWRSTSALIAANTLLVALSVAAGKLIANARLVSTVTALAGVGLCICWLLVSRRQFAYYAYWFAWARHLERRYFVPEVSIVTTGKTYGEGGTIEASPDLPKLERFPSTARVPVLALITAVIVAFLLIYFAVIWAAWCH